MSSVSSLLELYSDKHYLLNQSYFNYLPTVAQNSFDISHSDRFLSGKTQRLVQRAICSHEECRRIFTERPVVTKAKAAGPGKRERRRTKENEKVERRMSRAFSRYRAFVPLHFSRLLDFLRSISLPLGGRSPRTPGSVFTRATCVTHDYAAGA